MKILPIDEIGKPGAAWGLFQSGGDFGTNAARRSTAGLKGQSRLKGGWARASPLERAL